MMVKTKPKARLQRRKSRSTRKSQSPQAKPAKTGDSAKIARTPAELEKISKFKTTLRQKMKLKQKYKGQSPKDFTRWRYQKRCFWYNHEIAYKEDRLRRNALMKEIADTANSYMRIRKALGYSEYDWTDNGPFFLSLGLSKSLWRKTVKRLVNRRLKSSLSSPKGMPKGTYPQRLPPSDGSVDSGQSPHSTDSRQKCRRTENVSGEAPHGGSPVRKRV